jgi:hypothetical protein
VTPPLLYKPLLNIQSYNPLKTRVHDILGGHFVSSPLGRVKKAGGPGKFCIVRDLPYHNRDGYAVNDHLDSDDFPAGWGTCAQIADIVSNRISILFVPCWVRTRGCDTIIEHCEGVCVTAHWDTRRCGPSFSLQVRREH